MPKNKFSYDLIGSVYDGKSNSYLQETIISLPDIEEDNLVAIDTYTTGMHQLDFMKTLPEKYQDKNSYSIRVTNNTTGYHYYVKAIFHQPELHEELASIKKETVMLGASYKAVQLMPRGPLVDECWGLVTEALDKRDRDLLEHYFSPKSTYYFKLNRYLNSSFDYGVGEQELHSLYMEFRDYPLFRKVFVARDKKIKNFGTHISKKHPALIEPTVLKMPEFGADYIQQQVIDYNTSGKKEEFLDASEILGFWDLEDDGYGAYPQLKRKAVAKQKKKTRNSHEEY